MGTLDILGAMFVVGLFVNWRSVQDALLTVGATVVVLLAAWYGQRLARQAQSAQKGNGTCEIGICPNSARREDGESDGSSCEKVDLLHEIPSWMWRLILLAGFVCGMVYGAALAMLLGVI